MRGRSVALLTQSCLTSLITQSVVRMRFAHPCLCRLIFITAGGKTEYSMATKLPSRTSLDFQLYPGAVCESCTSQTCLMVEKQTEVLDNSWLGGSSFGAWPGFQESLQFQRSREQLCPVDLPVCHPGVFGKNIFTLRSSCSQKKCPGQMRLSRLIYSPWKSWIKSAPLL